MTPDLFIHRDASVSKCGQYRSFLSRFWRGTTHWLGWIMLNPSTADGTIDDPTIRRCMNFAFDLGFNGICVTNLFGYRATDPEALYATEHPICPPTEQADWDQRMLDLFSTCPTVVAAWGTHGSYRGRDEQVWQLFSNHGVGFKCLGLTRDGYPRHPLYVASDTKLIDFPTGGGRGVNHRFKLIPAHLLTDDHRGPYHGQALAAWQWFCRRMASTSLRRSDGNPPWEWLNGTSSINNQAPNPICGEDEHGYADEAKRRMRELLVHAGRDNGPGRFLRRCGIGSWAALNKPITINIPSDGEFPNPAWFNLRGRVFKRSPNDCHARATWVMGGQLQLNREGTLWTVRVEHGYRHDGSHWWFNLPQRQGQSLADFRRTVDARLEKVLVAETVDDGRFRPGRERDWSRTFAALRDVFADHPDFLFHGRDGQPWEVGLTDLMHGIQGGAVICEKIWLNRKRLSTLKRWARSDARKSRKGRAAA